MRERGRKEQHDLGGRKPVQRAEALGRSAEARLPSKRTSILEGELADTRQTANKPSRHEIEPMPQNEELQRAQSDLRNSLDAYFELYDFAPVGLFTLDAQETITEVNRAAWELLGESRERVLGKRITAFITPESQDAFGFHQRRLLKSRRKESTEIGMLREGEPFPVRLESIALVTAVDAPPRILVAAVDITEEKRNEEHRLLGSRLDSLATLAGGIGHDFNNLLMGILGNVDLACERLGRQEEAGRLLAEARKACLRARALAGQLLTFAQGGAPVKEILPLGGLIRDAVRFALSGSNVVGEFDFPGDLWPVVADESQLRQVIAGLVLNAREAMPAGGVVRVAASNRAAGSDSAPAPPAGDCVEIVVADQGSGIPAEVLDHVFDPHFSTKPNNSGLGLSIAYSIVRRHGGAITVESKVNAGTSVRVRLPASPGASPWDAAAADMEPAPANDTAPGPSSGLPRARILIMDDEPLVRELLQTMLSHLGYEAEVSAEGGECLTRYRAARESGRPFDVVLLDLTVPAGMGGLETARELRRLDPNSRLIVSSGYADHDAMANYRKYGFSDMVAKPFLLAGLEEVLARVLA